MASIITYLIFNGEAQKAMSFYKTCFGGQLHVTKLIESPLGCDFPEWMQNATLHASLIQGNLSLYASDLSDETPSGRINTVFVHCENQNELSTILEKLQPTSKSVKNLQRNHWNIYVSSLIDQFNVEWIFYLPEIN